MPDPDAVDDLLRRTLDDFRFSRTERRALDLLLDDQPDDPATLDRWRSRAFALARLALADGGGPEVLDWLEGVEKLLDHRASNSREAPAESFAYFTPGDAVPRVIAGLFDRARTCVDVCVFTITDDRISSAMLAAHR